MPTTAGRPKHPARPLEPHAQQLPEGGDGAGERAPWLGGAVPGAPTDDGALHPRGEQVAEGLKEGGPGPGGREAGTQQAQKPRRSILVGKGPKMTADCPEASVSLLSLPHFDYSLRHSMIFTVMYLPRGFHCSSEYLHSGTFPCV